MVVALYEGSKSWKKAEAAGLTVMTTAEAAKVADMIMILINDEKQAAMYHKDIEPYLRPGMILAFAHGFNIHFGCIKPPKDIDVVMIAPKGPGHTVRSQYLEGKGVPDLVAVYQDASGKAQDRKAGLMVEHPGLGEGGRYHTKKGEHPLPDGTVLTFALAGNQNCGKTTLFNQLTGSNQHVGNFPGVTVDRKSGAIREHPDTEVTDLPGIYSTRRC